MTGRWTTLAAAIFLLAPGAQGQTAEPAAITLGEAVSIARARHPDVAKAKASADALKGKIREVKAQALPEVNFGSNAMRWRDPSLLNASGLDKFPAELRNALVPEPVNLFDYSITVKQPIYTAGKVGTALRLASIESEGAQLDVDRAEQDLSASVVRAFYALMWAERYRLLVAATEEQRTQHLAMARARFRGGVATEVDVLRSEVALANTRPDVVRADNAIRQARAQLNYYLARPVDFPTRAVGEFEEKAWTEGDFETLVQEAMRRRPELQRLRIAERSAQATLDLAKAESRLRLDFSGAYGVMARLPSNLFNADYTRWNMALNFTLPVFDGYRRSGLVYQASANQRAATLERQRVEQQVRLDLQQAWDEMAAAKETVTAAQANIKQAERVLSMTQDNYKYGAATTLDVVDAQTALTEARTNLLRGLHDYALARSNLRYAAGMTPWE